MKDIDLARDAVSHWIEIDPTNAQLKNLAEQLHQSQAGHPGGNWAVVSTQNREGLLHLTGSQSETADLAGVSFWLK
jgi:hypothetical protein